METREIIKQAQEENLVGFQASTTEKVLSNLQDKIQQYTKYIGYQASEFFKSKE